MKEIMIDPVTRIEGHLKFAVHTEDGVVRDARSSGTLFRGFEIILKGKDPLDALRITPRISVWNVSMRVPWKTVRPMPVMPRRISSTDMNASASAAPQSCGATPRARARIRDRMDKRMRNTQNSSLKNLSP